MTPEEALQAKVAELEQKLEFHEAHLKDVMNRFGEVLEFSSLVHGLTNDMQKFRDQLDKFEKVLVQLGGAKMIGKHCPEHGRLLPCSCGRTK